MTSIRDNQRDNATNSNLLKKINRKQNRPSPGLNPVSSIGGFSGENTYRKMPDGTVQHGMKYGKDWFYRSYTKSGKDEWDITNLIGVERIQSLIFKNNLYSGIGWQIAKDDRGDYTLEIDNIIARKTMTIWELIINRLRASNGTFIVGSSAKVGKESTDVVKTGSYSYDITFEADGAIANVQPFVVGDVIACKRFWLRDEHPQAGTEQVVAQVAELYPGDPAKISVNIQSYHSVGTIKPGMDFVRVASSVASRQGLVVLSSDGNDNIEDGVVVVPFIDVYDGLETYDNFLSALGGDTDFIKVRMGRLDQLTGGTDEFGLWTNLIHIVGTAVEGVNNIHAGTRAEFNALTSTQTDTYHNGDVWIMTDENNNILTWNPDGVDVVGLPDDIWGNRQISLTIGIEYTIKIYDGSDDFINVGAGSNAQGVVFRATGIDPTVWDASTLTQYWVDRTNSTILQYRTDVLAMINESAFWQEDKNTINILERMRAFDVLAEFESNHTAQLAEASYFGVSSTAYETVYDALVLYMRTTITWTNTGDFKTGVSGTTWVATWTAVFTQLALLQDAIVEATENQIPSDADGKLKNTPNTGTAGLYLGSVNMGYHDGGVNWLTYMDNTGQFYLKGGLGTCLWWKPADTALYIGGLSAGDAYIKAVAGSANIEWYGGNPSYNFMTMGADINGTGWYGINLEEKAFIYKHNNNNNAVSTLHSELYNQTTNYIGGISSLVSTTTDASTPSLTTINIVSAYKGMAYVTSNYNSAGIIGQGEGGGGMGSGGVIQGGYFTGKAGGISATSYGVKGIGEGGGGAYGGAFSASGGYNVNYGISATADGTGGGYAYGIYASASGGSIANWAGYFASGNVNINNTLIFGTAGDTNLYRSAVNTLKTDDNFICLTLNTGQGANELYAMNQAVQTSNMVQFARVNIDGVTNYIDTDTGELELISAGAMYFYGSGDGFIFNDDLTVGANKLIGATLNTGQGDNNLFDMNQNVLTTSSPTFAYMKISEVLSAPDHTAGQGIYWVDDETITRPRFTTDTGLDDVIATVDIRTATGHPSAWEGRIELNTFDNKIYMYADGAWRLLSSW